MLRTDTPEGELNHEFARMVRAAHLMREIAVRWVPSGVDPAALQLLVMLVKGGPSRQNELAEQTFFDPSTVSRRVSQLVTHGLVERQPDPGDGRAIRLAATSDGVTLVGQVRDARDGITRDMLAQWPDDDVAALTALLRRYNDALEAYRRSAASSTNPTATVTGVS